MTLADLGTSLKPPTGSATELEGSKEGQSWQEALGGLFGGADSQATSKGDKREALANGDETSNVAQERQGDVSWGKAEVSGDDEVVVDWGLMGDQSEHSDPKSGASKAGGESLESKEPRSKAGGKRTTDNQGSSHGLGETAKRKETVLRKPIEKPITGARGTVIQKPPKPPEGSTCREWMAGEWERWEAGFRKFSEQPVRIVDAGARSWFETTQAELEGCDIGCEMHAAGESVQTYQLTRLQANRTV